MMGEWEGHYKFLDRYLNAFWLLVFDKSLQETWCSGIAVAHGDKCGQYQSAWLKAGIPFHEGAMLYMLTYTSEMDMEKWFSMEWVIKNHPKYKPLIDQAVQTVDAQEVC